MQLKSVSNSLMFYRFYDLHGNYRHKKRITKPTNMKATYAQQVRVLSATATHVKYSTHIDNFYYVRKAKIKQYKPNNSYFFVAVFGLLKHKNDDE